MTKAVIDKFYLISAFAQFKIKTPQPLKYIWFNSKIQKDIPKLMYSVRY